MFAKLRPITLRFMAAVMVVGLLLPPTSQAAPVPSPTLKGDFSVFTESTVKDGMRHISVAGQGTMGAFLGPFGSNSAADVRLHFGIDNKGNFTGPDSFKLVTPFGTLFGKLKGMRTVLDDDTRAEIFKVEMIITGGTGLYSRVKGRLFADFLTSGENLAGALRFNGKIYVMTSPTSTGCPPEKCA